MTPKEKAEELVGRMYLIHSKVTFYFAKEGALIAVDEIINQYYEHTDNVTQHEYWQQVKKEVEKL
jgi:hypothetical protein